MTRRQAVGAVAGAVAGAFDMPGLDEAAERRHVLACGFTEAEADCWVLVARAVGAFFALPKLHPMDDHEVAHAIHVVQHKLLSRPAYRKYKGTDRGGK
jgi:hypothetical protein